VVDCFREKFNIISTDVFQEEAQLIVFIITMVKVNYQLYYNTIVEAFNQLKQRIDKSIEYFNCNPHNYYRGLNYLQEFILYKNYLEQCNDLTDILPRQNTPLIYNEYYTNIYCISVSRTSHITLFKLLYIPYMDDVIFNEFYGELFTASVLKKRTDCETENEDFMQNKKRRC
jgi:hypothetical protein